MASLRDLLYAMEERRQACYEQEKKYFEQMLSLLESGEQVDECVEEVIPSESRDQVEQGVEEFIPCEKSEYLEQLKLAEQKDPIEKEYKKSFSWQLAGNRLQDNLNTKVSNIIEKLLTFPDIKIRTYYRVKGRLLLDPG